MLSVDSISHAYDAAESLKDVSLSVGEDEILCLLGPSGCGKTTLLRIIAGLISGYRGAVIFDGKDLSTAPVHSRGFGLMFQDFALFPHMSVADNIAYGLRRQGMPRRRIKGRVEEMLARVGLERYGPRDVATLSGGEMQRVALARSLAPQPRFLMLDEPLGSLDALLRDQLALQLRDILKSAGLSAIYVTHDHREAYAIADRIAVMQTGQIMQIDRPFDIYHSPASESVARFLGFPNIFRFDDSDFTREMRDIFQPLAADADRFLIHPRGIHLNTGDKNLGFHRRGQIESVVFRGDHSEVRVIIDGDIGLTCKSQGQPPPTDANVDITVEESAIIRWT